MLIIVTERQKPITDDNYEIMLNQQFYHSTINAHIVDLCNFICGGSHKTFIDFRILSAHFKSSSQ